MQTETTAEQKELWFLGDDKHWTQYDLSEMKKYVFQLKGQIDDLNEELKLLRIINNNRPKNNDVIEVNKTLVSQVLAYEMQKKNGVLTTDQFAKDKEFIAGLFHVPITWTVKLSKEKETNKKTITKIALAYLLNKRGLNNALIARSMGYRSHSSAAELLRNSCELTQEQVQSIDNYLTEIK